MELEKALVQGGRASPILVNRLASLYLKAEKPGRSLDLLKDILEVDRDFVTTWENLGRVHRVLGNRQEALSSFREAARINPFNPYTRQSLLELYIEAGMEEEAVREEDALVRLGYAERWE